MKSINLFILFSIITFTNSYAVHEPVEYDRTVIQNGSSVCLDKKKPAGEKVTWIKKLKAKIIGLHLKKLSAPVDGEISNIKKVLSVLSLVFGALSIISLFAIGNGWVFSLIGVLITGIIALINNPSKKHRTMALIGVMLGVASIVIVALAIASI